MQIDPTKLVEARLVRAMSQEEAALAADLSARTIQRIEAGHSASLESTKALLTTFGADIIHDPLTDATRKPVSPWYDVAAQIGRASRRSASWSFDGLRLLFVANFVLIALAKPFVPNQTGLFVGDDAMALGLLRQQPAGTSELLGYWIMPLLLLAAITLLASFGKVRQRFAAIRRND